MAQVIAVSHFWRSRADPDPKGEVVRLLGAKLEKDMQTYGAAGYEDMGLFFDWASLFQEVPGRVERTDQQKQAFKRGLQNVGAKAAARTMDGPCSSAHTAITVLAPPLKPVRGGSRACVGGR